MSTDSNRNHLVWRAWVPHTAVMLQLPVCELVEAVLHNSDTTTADRASVLPLLTQRWVIQHLLVNNSSKAFSQLLKKISKADFPTYLLSSYFLFNQDHGVSRSWTNLDLSEHFAPSYGLYLNFCSLMQLEMISPSFTATMWDGEKKMHPFNRWWRYLAVVRALIYSWVWRCLSGLTDNLPPPQMLCWDWTLSQAERFRAFCQQFPFFFFFPIILSICSWFNSV